MVDIHTFFDSNAFTPNGVVALARQHGVTHVIFSPPAVVGATRKSAILYWFQRVMLRSNVLSPLASLAASTFYDKSGVLRKTWRVGIDGDESYHSVEIPDNHGLAQAVETVGVGVFRWYWINPLKSSLERDSLVLKDPKVVGIKIHPYWHRFGAEYVEQVLNVAQVSSLPVYMHMGYRGLSQIVEVLTAYPKVSVLLACGGYPHFDRVWRKVRRLDNVCVDVASQHIDVRGIRAAAHVLGDERILFSTDAPYSFADTDDVSSYKGLVNRIQRVFSQPEAFERVTRLNAFKRIPRLVQYE